MRRYVTLALAFAFALRCLLPAGVMETVASDGSVAIVLCTGHGPLQVEVDDQGRVIPKKPSKSQQNTLCPFAAVGAIALHASPAVLLHEQRYAHAAYALAPMPERRAQPPSSRNPRGPPFDLS